MFVRAKTLFALSLALLLSQGFARAQDTPPSEYRLKAAFLFNFAKFVEWPPAAFTNETAPLIIGVLGDNPFGNDLEQTVRGKQIGSHPIITRKIVDPAEARDCHLLFVSTSEKNRLTEVFRQLNGRPVLTIGETDGFTETGGMINFVRQENKIRFQINNEAANAAGLKINSKLLGLAVSSAPPR